ncbi:DUF4157 domain-containing protein [Nocardioides conyzicola]|uniref:eCIS core domain-containing protein n=1 Tax=Nocardioides conyzicola TaxID=1651781 RepID=A0ABP8XI81_9ACTN
MSRAGFAPRTPARAMRSIVEGADRAVAAPDQVEAPTARRALEVGSADDRAEHEADAVAEQVLARLGTPHVHDDHEPAVRRAPGSPGTIGAAGGALDDASSSAIESARGGGSALDAGVRREMEAGFGHSLGDVRIHTDTRADQLSGQMSARAFTTGRDIFFAKGQYDPASAEGRHTLAHELAHTVQDGGAARRKLRGTAEALESQGGGPTSGKLRKMVGMLTNWDKIVAGTRAYEAEEEKLLAGGKNPDPIKLMKAKPGMLKILTKVQSAVKDWRKANDSDKQDDKFEKSRFTGSNKDIEENQSEDVRTKAPRRQAVALLEPRVGNEVSLLSSKDSQGWLSSLGLSTKQVGGTGRTDGGQVNQVSELHYQTESGAMTGFFKEDKGFNAKSEGHEIEVGIKQIDPNYGARSVALYRLDQLFNAGVTARAEFAVHKNGDGKSVLGTVLESAKGTKAVDVKYHAKGDEKSGDSLGLDDPVLQRGLNKLQLLDAICGQLDRHMGNYFIQDDGKGNVTGVTGIDLDMAFGSNMQSTAYKGAMNYKGLPEYIDKEMGSKILLITPADIRGALTGLLSKSEIEATVARFTEVQKAVKQAEKDGKLQEKWDETTAQRGPKYDKSRHGQKTYHESARENRRIALDVECDAAMRRALRDEVPDGPDLSDRELNRLMVAALDVGNFWGGNSNSPAVAVIAAYIFDNHLPTTVVDRVAEAFVREVVGGLDMSAIIVELQEAGDGKSFSALTTKVRDQVRKALTANAGPLQKKLAAAGGQG